MRRRLRSFGSVVVLATAVSHPALAQSSDCADFKWPVTREITAFANDKLLSVANGAPLPGMMEAANLTLTKQDAAAFVVAPSHKPKREPAYAGVFTLPPLAAGTYQVTVSDEAWIDVVQGGKLLKQTGFTGSHGCKAVRKSVQFTLSAGPATIEISDAASDAMKLEVLPREQ